MRNPDCNLCPLHSTAKTVCMWGRGADKPKFFFIGEAPGADEDDSGKPFIGRSGKLLIDHIKKYEVGPARVSNSVRCRPPSNRTPVDAEVAACRVYLKEEIRESKPQFIVAVGGVALKVLTGKDGITNWSGRLAGEVAGIPVLALMHPAYVMRSGNYEDFRKDFVSLKNVADTIEIFKRNFPEAEISDAVGHLGTDEGIAHGNQDAENRDMLRFKGRLRSQLMASVPDLLKKARKEEKKRERESGPH